MFDVKRALTIENILEKITEYDIFKAYCPNFQDVDKKFVATLNRTKTEDYPSANITYYRGKLWYKDFGSSDKAMDCFSYIQAKYKATFVQALGIINLDFNLGLQGATALRPSLNYIGLPDIIFSKKEKESTIIRPKFRQWLQRDYKYWVGGFSILKPTLEYYKVKPIQWYLLNDKFIQAEKLTYSYFVDEEDSVKYYKIYSPLSLTSKWITNCKAHHYQGYNQLPMSGDLLIITKALKDVMELYQMGYNSIAPSSEASLIDDDFMRLLHRKFERVVIFFDNDEAGIKGADRLTHHHGINSIIIPYEYHAKDISDAVKLHGFDKGREIMKGLLNGGNEIFIPGQIPSLKNSKVMGKYPSKTVQKWLRTFGIQHYSSGKKEIIYFKRIPKLYNFAEIVEPIKKYQDYPLLMGFHFVRNSNRMWDFGNACQIIQDMMVAHDVIPDDNVNYLLPFPMLREGKYWSYNPDSPGVYITIL